LGVNITSVARKMAENISCETTWGRIKESVSNRSGMRLGT
jgi:hypothetical protein